MEEVFFKDARDQGVSRSQDRPAFALRGKPDNVFVTRDRRAKLLDFGMADDWTKAVKVFDAISQHPPMRLSEALRWQERHAGESASSLLRQRGVTTFAELHTQLNGQLEAVVGRALQKEPWRRHPSAAAFASDVSRHLAGGRI